MSRPYNGRLNFEVDIHMSQELQHIDAIAREKNRDVLFIHFEHYEVQSDIRDIVLAWLEDHEIAYTPCMGIAEENLIDSYLGDIYVDVPFDSRHFGYQELSEYLEDEEGNMKIDGVLFFVLSLDVALEIANDRDVQDCSSIQ